MAKVVHVAAAVILNECGEILLAKRPDDKHQGGLWEFPGGKVESGEQASDALYRELEEELGVQVTSSRPLIQVPYHYPDKSVLLDVYQVDAFEGQPYGREGQPVRWVAREALGQYDFPAANAPIVTAAKLADKLIISGAFEHTGDFAQRLRCSLASVDRCQFMLRAPDCSETELVELAEVAASVCNEDGTELIINCDIALANQQQWSAVHLNSQRLAALGHRKDFNGQLLGASCHNAQQLDMAVAKGLDYVTLSPVQQTCSHPEATALGWAAFAELSRPLLIPVYALGGLTGEHIPQALLHGAQGVAAISAWWSESEKVKD